MRKKRASKLQGHCPRGATWLVAAINERSFALLEAKPKKKFAPWSRILTPDQETRMNYPGQDTRKAGMRFHPCIASSG